MSKMAEIAMEIEEMLMRGEDTNTIAQALHIPLKWVLDVEEDLMQLANPRFYGPDYGE